MLTKMKLTKNERNPEILEIASCTTTISLYRDPFRPKSSIIVYDAKNKGQITLNGQEATLTIDALKELLRRCQE